MSSSLWKTRVGFRWRVGVLPGVLLMLAGCQKAPTETPRFSGTPPAPGRAISRAQADAAIAKVQANTRLSPAQKSEAINKINALTSASNSSTSIASP